MTMLDRMRRHKGWLKWSLFLVVVAFIALYFPDFMRQDTGAAAPGDVVARVGGEDITAGEFRRAYMSQIAMYQRAYGNSVNPDLLRQMGIDQQILRQMLDERAAVQEARRLGLKVSDAEIAQRVRSMPAFQRDGHFAGTEMYRMVLRSQSPPLTTTEFEESLRRSLLVDKLRRALTDWIAVSDAAVESEFRRRNEKVKADLVVFSADRFRDQVTLADADVAAYFEKHKEQYRVPEKRKIKYLLIDIEAMKARITVPPGDVERYYRQNIEQYSSPEQVRASHILFKTEGKDEAEVRRKAEEVLKQVKAGGDFGALARKFSEDEGSAKQDGDLDYFGRGRMVKEFEDVAFSLAPGSVSDLVKSQFGFHIIKVVDKKPASTRPFEEVKAQITDQLAAERAQTQASELAAALSSEIDDAADLDRVAKARGLSVKESGFFARDEPILGIGPAPEVSSQAFELKEGAVEGPVRTSGGQVFFTTTARQDSHLPTLDAVKDRVRDDALRQKAAELARARAQSLASELKTDFTAATKQAGLEVKTTELIARGSTWPDVGISPALDAAAFSLPVGGVSGPIPTDAGTAVVHIVQREEIDGAALAAARDTLRNELLEAERNKFYSAYMQKVQDRFKTEINQDVLRRMAG
jgi:peptidyl-prolyl cis-trans isomerase D